VRSKEKDEGLNKLLEGEMEKGEKEASPSPPLATKLGTFHWPPSFGSTFTSLLLLLKR
jgi:hypothetical protein